MSRVANELVIDTSALMALLLQESDAEALLDAAARASKVHLSTASRLELGLMAESARHGVEGHEVEQLLLALEVRLVPFDQHQLHWALAGWRRFGKGRHEAALNVGDCFSYGLAMALDLPLLFKGDDFAATDVQPALPS
ncbi:type II toxin-antitoxin system VapC family toxin [Cyanobium sp. ATX 6A2]|uniref:type II toxin-antitoxin system VapC family toxin n=1 Tax=Cyanobium sp. ATX 6A2 TaxID=2823700 RepID=UPI0020CDD2E5|nr:type II toxin-antitoxin system VapC family toxin [Cyanobium sp. ATX 6A2]